MLRRRSSFGLGSLLTAVLLLGGLLLAPSSAARVPRGFTVRPAIPASSRLSSAVISTMQFGRSDGSSDRSFRLVGINRGGLSAPTSPAPYGPATPTNYRVSQDESHRPHNETSVAAQGKRVVVGANDYRIGNPVGGGFYTSPDRGATWSDGLMPFPLLTNDAGIIEPPAGTGDPAVAIARDGTIYQASIGFSFTWCENGVFVYKSTNGGLTWTRPVVPDLGGPSGIVTYYDSADSCFVDGGPETDVFHDKEYIAVDNSGGPRDGRIYVTWSKFEATDSIYAAYDRSAIMMSYSDDGGATWSPVVIPGQAQPGEINGSDATFCTFQADGEAAGRCDENQGSVPVVAPDGTVYVAFINEQNDACWGGFDFRDQYLVSHITPTGATTFSMDGPYQAVDCMIDGIGDYPTNTDGRQTLSNSNFRVWGLGNIAVNPKNGDLYLVWSDNRNGDAASTNTDVFVTVSADDGVTWSAPKRVNKDPAGADRDQWFPWVSVNRDGVAGVVFYDRRRDPDNELADTFMAFSSNGFATISNKRITNVQSNFDHGFREGLFIGDYLGVKVTRCQAYPVWADARNGTAAVRYTDLFGATVTVLGC